MQRQISTWFWVFLVLFLGLGTTGKAQARKHRTLCGVDVSYQYRCWKELKRLVSACQSTPVICGRSYKNGTMPRSRSALRRCKQMYRSQRRRWREGLCGVRLFSRPHTYCGVRGVQVAIACIKKRNKGMTPKPSVGEVHSKRTTRGSSARQARSVSASGVKRSVSTSSKVASGSVKKKPVVGQVQSSNPSAGGPSGQGSSFWIYVLQFLTLGLVLLLLFRRKEAFSSRSWEQRSSRMNDVESQWDMSMVHDNDTDLSRVETSLEQIELRLQVWEEQWREKSRSDDPIASLQPWAVAVHSYYCRIADVLAKGQGPQSLSDVQRRLLEGRDKLRWMFQAHREPLSQASAVEQLQIELLSSTDSLLKQTGYSEGEQKISALLSQGQFSVDEFLARKAEEQAQRFIEDEPLQSFSAIRNEFLQRLEQLYRSNLSELLEGEDQQSLVDNAEQNRIFLNDYILGFLLRDLPSKLEGYSHQSNRERSGALADQMIQFIEEELSHTGLELFPVFEKSEFMSVHAHFLYMARAGVRMVGQEEVVLREADPTLLEVRSQTDETEPEAPSHEVLDDISQSTAEYSSQSPEMIMMDQMIGVAIAQPESLAPPAPIHSPLDVPEVQVEGRLEQTAAYHEDLLDGIDEITMGEDAASQAEEHIGNPDSDPPTAEATTELNINIAPDKLPRGPLPAIDPTKNYVNAKQERAKITREYGSMQHDSELPYSLNPSED